ncbi:18919_t:CDS:1, partial [Racocetra fulgida]
MSSLFVVSYDEFYDELYDEPYDEPYNKPYNESFDKPYDESCNKTQKPIKPTNMICLDESENDELLFPTTETN